MKTLIFQTDGGCRTNPGPAASGVYFPKTGMGFGLFIGESRTNNEAEAEALIAALDYARANGVTHLDGYSDSQLLVNLVTGKWRASAPTMEAMLDKIQDRLEYFMDWNMTWVPRAKNADADWLCNQVLDAYEKGDKWTTPKFLSTPSLVSSSLPIV